MRSLSFAVLGLCLSGLSGSQVACATASDQSDGGDGGNGAGSGTSSGASSTGGSGSGGGQGSSGASGSGGSTGGSSGTASGGGSGSGGGTGSSGGNSSSSGATGSSGSMSSSTSSGGSGSGSGGGPADGGGGGGGDGGAGHWVATWTGSPYFDSANQPPASLMGSVLRQVTHASLGGNRIRVQFSNLFGNGPVTINSAHIALCKATPAVDSTIDTTTDKALAFSGAASVTIAQGMEVWSDPIDFALPALGNVTITTAFGAVPSNVCGHSGSRTTSYLQTGSNNVSAASMTTSVQTFQHWYYISGIDVMADASAKAAVAIGDSITDGRGTDNDMNNRWTDILAARMQANAATATVSMTNQGIGATNLVGTSGTAAQARFARDVLGQSGVRYAIVFDGVNDIGGGASYASLKSAYDDLISRAHAKGLLIYGATITPFGGNAYYTVAHEMVRQQVNTYIKSGAFDGYIDFDAAVTDNGNPPKLQAVYAMWAQMDGLHPGPAGYKQMGDSVDLTLFTK